MYTGIQVIDWLLKWSFVSDRNTGVNLACMLIEDAHLQPVGLTSKISFKRKTEFENATIFLDDTDALYRFVSWLKVYMTEIFYLLDQINVNIVLLQT